MSVKRVRASRICLAAAAVCVLLWVLCAKDVLSFGFGFCYMLPFGLFTLYLPLGMAFFAAFCFLKSSTHFKLLGVLTAVLAAAGALIFAAPIDYTPERFETTVGGESVIVSRHSYLGSVSHQILTVDRPIIPYVLSKRTKCTVWGTGNQLSEDIELVQTDSGTKIIFLGSKVGELDR